MPFIQDILSCRSVSLVGMEKNTGKTECLNYILKRLPVDRKKICVTSIGVDGETTDRVTLTPKPQIVMPVGCYFSTAERYYRDRKLVAELVDLSRESTPLGPVVTARSLVAGEVMLSGPSSAQALSRWMKGLEHLGIDLTLIDGALSRVSSASPAVSEAMILSTGAALSAHMPTLLMKTAFQVEMIRLPMTIVPENEGVQLSALGGGILAGESLEQILGDRPKVIRVVGALTDRFLKRVLDTSAETEVVVKDFSRLFLSPEVYRAFQKKGGRITVEQRSRLLAVCVNPTSPTGIRFDSDTLCGRLSEQIGLPVYDIVKNRYEA